MEFTEQQIARLYRFTREHYVEHYDVQSELVDHLANDIEKIISENPNLTFDEALHSSFKKFGVFGFMDIVEAKNKAMGKKYWKLVWSIFKGFFEIPQIAVSFVLFLCFLLLLELFPIDVVIISVGLGTTFLMFFKLFMFKKEQKKRFKDTQKKWLLEEYVYNLGGSGIMFNLFIQISFFAPEFFTNPLKGLAAGLLTGFVLLAYITTFILPKQITSILSSQYAEYKLV